MIEALSEATPGTIQQRSARSEMVWRALNFNPARHPLATSWNYDIFMTYLGRSGLDKEQVKAAIALLFG